MEDFSVTNSGVDVSLRILIYDGKSLMLNIKRNSKTHLVYQMAVEQLKITPVAARYCALFEMIDSNFERKLYDVEYIHNIYIQNYYSAASSCILFRKWCFDIEMEKVLCEKDKIFRLICFYQAVNDVNTEIICAKDRLYQLKALQSEEKSEQVLINNNNFFKNFLFFFSIWNWLDNLTVIRVSFFHNVPLKLMKILD